MLCFVVKNSYLIQEHHRQQGQPPCISQQQLAKAEHPSPQSRHSSKWQ